MIRVPRCAVPLLIISCLLAVLSPAFASLATVRASVSSEEIEGDGESGWPSLSPDGRYAAFGSVATNLVPGDTNGYSDAFVRNRLKGTTERISVSSAGVEGDGDSYTSYEPNALSADGRFVTFYSCATNLVADDTNGYPDVFVHDRQTGATTRVSVDSVGNEGNGCSFRGTISADGRYVAFASCASNLVEGDTTSYWPDVFVHDRQTGVTERVSLSATDGELDNCSVYQTISADGRYVAFATYAGNTEAAGLDPECYPADGNNVSLAEPIMDILVRDRTAGTTEVISQDPSGWAVCDHSYEARISADGRYVAYTTADPWPIGGDSVDTNDAEDVFLWDRQSQITERVSLSSTGGELNGNSWGGAVNADARYVGFTTEATNSGYDRYAWGFSPPDIDGYWDVFVRDRQGATTEWISHMPGYCSGCGGDSNVAGITADGKLMSFKSDDPYFVPDDTNTTWDVFLVGDFMNTPVPDVLLEVHPNERAPGIGTPWIIGGAPWTQPMAGPPQGSYWWKKYEFAAHGPLWIQVCAENWDKTQKGYLDHDDTKLQVNGVAPPDYDGIQSGTGSWQWTGGAESGKRVTLRFLVPVTPGKQELWIGADESPALWWLKVIDLEPGIIEPIE